MSSGLEALIDMSSIQPDVLIADLNMPGVDGFELLRTIRHTPQFNRMTCLVVSALSQEDIAARGGLPEGTVFMAKPINMQWFNGFVTALIAGTVGRLMQVPLAAGDTGVQGITGVVGSVATAGTFNVLVMRPLWTGRCRIANDGDVHGLDKTGMPQVYTDSALYVAVAPDSTARGLPEMYIEIANG